MRANSILLIATLLLSSPACAQEPDYAGMLLKNNSLLLSPPKNCNDKSADLDSFSAQQCSAVALRDADREMNVLYMDALKSGDPARNDKLCQAQRNWLAFRNFECDWESQKYKGGTLEPVVMGECLATITRERVKQLREGIEP